MTGQKLSGSRAYEVITPPNTLKAKLGPGKGVDAEALERAREIVAGMASDFEARAVADVEQILTLVARIENDDAANSDGADDRNGGHDRMVDIFRIGHELKGQGGTFGYPLISRIGGSLCAYIESVSDDSTVDLEIVRAHAHALRVVAGKRITGEGGPVEKQVISELDRLLKRQASA